MIFPNQMKQDLIDMQPELPVIRGVWRLLKRNKVEHVFEVAGVCPMCALANHVGLITTGQLADASYPAGPSTTEEIAEYYGIPDDDLMQFVYEWDKPYHPNFTTVTERIRYIINFLESQ